MHTSLFPSGYETNAHDTCVCVWGGGGGGGQKKVAVHHEIATSESNAHIDANQKHKTNLH